MAHTSLQRGEITDFSLAKLSPILRTLASSVEQESHTLDIPGIRKAQHLCAADLERFGLNIRLVDTRERGPILIAETRAAIGREDAFIICGHVDTVHEREDYPHTMRIFSA